MNDANDMTTRLLAAAAIAREAGALVRRRFQNSSYTVGFKGPQDYLTEVDGETERLIAARLGEAFPHDGFIGEETSRREAAAGRPVWIVDPIDGTSNFAHGAPHFCVSIACLVGRTIEIGVIYDPMRDELFEARRGAGARLNGAAMRASATTSLGRGLVEVGWNLRDGVEVFADLMRRVVSTGAAPLRCGSGALGLAYVAAGRWDGYVEQHINAWDCLAAVLMVREAGGYVSDFLARDGLTKGNPILAAAPGVKDALIAAASPQGIVL